MIVWRDTYTRFWFFLIPCGKSRAKASIKIFTYHIFKNGDKEVIPKVLLDYKSSPSCFNSIDFILLHFNYSNVSQITKTFRNSNKAVIMFAHTCRQRNARRCRRRQVEGSRAGWVRSCRRARGEARALRTGRMVPQLVRLLEPAVSHLQRENATKISSLPFIALIDSFESHLFEIFYHQ